MHAYFVVDSLDVDEPSFLEILAQDGVGYSRTTDFVHGSVKLLDKLGERIGRGHGVVVRENFGAELTELDVPAWSGNAVTVRICPRT